jgi:hypothetical protein
MLSFAVAAFLIPPVPVVITTSLPTAGANIRQFAFDGTDATHFAGGPTMKRDDHLTLTFDRPVSVRSLTVTTGRATGDDRLTAGVVEWSADGKAFDSSAKFTDGKASGDGAGKWVRAIRIRATEDSDRPLVVREIAIASIPAVIPFRFPVEFTLDVSDAPDMKEWAEAVVRVCERQYPMICTELASDGFTPPTRISMTFKNDYKGVAAAGGNRITGSVKYFKDHPKDVGAMVHETAHCVQSYRKRGLPGWLVEGIADYIRFWKYEPGTAGRLNPDRAQYNASYRTSAAFLAFVSDKYDPKLVTKLNAALRAGTYDTDLWKTLTGKPVEELNQEWRRSLVR